MARPVRMHPAIILVINFSGNPAVAISLQRAQMFRHVGYGLAAGHGGKSLNHAFRVPHGRVIPEFVAARPQLALVIILWRLRVILNFAAFARFQLRQIRNRFPQSRATLQCAAKQITHVAVNAMRRIRKWIFQFAGGRDHKKTPSDLRYAEVRCFQNAVRHMIVESLSIRA